MFGGCKGGKGRETRKSALHCRQLANQKAGETEANLPKLESMIVCEHDLESAEEEIEDSQEHRREQAKVEDHRLKRKQ